MIQIQGYKQDYGGVSVLLMSTPIDLAGQI